MDLGQFSISLPVADLDKTAAFYQAMGFAVLHDARADNWMMLERGPVRIGLFKDMFDAPLLTFNPPDVRVIEAQLKAAGYAPVSPAEDGTGPCHAMFQDPDGMTVLLDQHE